MQPILRLIAVALAVISVAACDQQKGYDQMNLRVEQVGDVPVSDIVKPPARVGEITTWRTDFRGQIFAVVKTEATCPREIHTVAGVDFKKACSEEVYVRYEIMGVPENVEPNFVFVGACTPSR